MEENQNQQTTAPTQVLTTAETVTGAPAVANGGDAGTRQTTQTTQTSQTVAVPDGYVKKEEVETERTARTAAETARVEAETRAQAAETRARSAEIRSTALALGFNDPADAERFIGSDVETDKIGEALKTVLEGKPYLGKAAEKPVVTPTSPTNPARVNTQAPVFTQAQIADRAFWTQNKAAIMQAMKEGRVQG